MCGIIACLHSHPSSSPYSAAEEIFQALYSLQHRGQDACGIITCAAGGKFYMCKGNGLASQVFQNGARVAELPGRFGVGHLRYPTAGSSSNSEAQPFYVNSPYGICFAHNGNLVNTPELRRFLDQEAHRHINTESDSELMLNIFANELNETGKARVNVKDVIAALKRTYGRCVGGWACTAMIAGFGLIGFRDPYGIRPLVVGSRAADNGGTDYMMASESIALTRLGPMGYKDFVDVQPGQAVIIEKSGKVTFAQIQEQIRYAPDIFEYVYFARPDSTIDGINVQQSRVQMGRQLARTIQRELPVDLLKTIDCVIPIPESASTATTAVAAELQLPKVDGFVKNRYIHRTFIMPTQRLRVKGVRAKLNAIDAEFKNKIVLLVDDSIVRGTTSREIVQMAHEAGAKKVIFASCAPPICYPHIYGIDLATANELIAHQPGHTINVNSPPDPAILNKKIAQQIGADWVVYQHLDDLKAACASLSPRGTKQEFEVGVFCGTYITPVPNDYFSHLEHVRGRKQKAQVAQAARDTVASAAAAESQLDALVGSDGETQTNSSIGPAVPTIRRPHAGYRSIVSAAQVAATAEGVSSSGAPRPGSGLVGDLDVETPGLEGFAGLGLSQTEHSTSSNYANGTRHDGHAQDISLHNLNDGR